MVGRRAVMASAQSVEPVKYGDGRQQLLVLDPWSLAGQKMAKMAVMLLVYLCQWLKHDIHVIADTKTSQLMLFVLRIMQDTLMLSVSVRLGGECDNRYALVNKKVKLSP
jgi:hypothetical protein